MRSLLQEACSQPQQLQLGFSMLKTHSTGTQSQLPCTLPDCCTCALPGTGYPRCSHHPIPSESSLYSHRYTRELRNH